MRGLEIKNLTVEVAGKKVVDGLSLSVPAGQVHAIMGPNGTGKSSLSKAIAGHPEYPITGGEVLLDGENIVGLPPDVIARKGFFLAFQYPVEIPGVSIANFIRACLSARLPEGQLWALPFPEPPSARPKPSAPKERQTRPPAACAPTR